MNDIELAGRLRSAGATPTEEFRAALESVLIDELHGRASTTMGSPSSTIGHGRLWLKVAGVAAVALSVVVAVVVRDNRDRPGSPGPKPTNSTAATAPTTTAATTPASGAATVSSDSAAVAVTQIWITGLDVGAERNEYGVDPFAIAAFQADGSLLTLDLRTDRASSIGLDGTMRWAIQVPADLEGRPLLDGAVGPDGNLYVAYQAATGEATFAAIATTGDRTGELVESWETNLGPCDRCVAFYLRADGIGIQYVDDPDIGDTIRTTPYVDPVTAGSFDPPLLVNTGTSGTGQLTFFTVTNTDEQTPTGDFWVVNAVGSSRERTRAIYHTPDGVFWAPFSTTADGSAMTAIITSAPGEPIATADHLITTLVVGRPGGSVELYRPLDDSTLIAYTERDDVIYAVLSIRGQPTYTLAVLSPTGPEVATGR